MSKKENMTLGQVMGKRGAAAASRGIDLHDLPDLLGEQMPKLEFHALGRVRLMRALATRFGKNFRSNPAIQHIIARFDEEVRTEAHHHMIKKKLGRPHGIRK